MTKPRVAISDPVTIFAEAGIYATFPSCAALDGGDVLIGYRGAYDDRYLQTASPETARMMHLTPRSQLFMQRLDPGLKPRHAPVLFPPDLAAADQDVNLLKLSNGVILLSSFAWKPIPEAMVPSAREAKWNIGYEPASKNAAIAWGTFVSVSKDEGISWSPRQYVDPIPGLPDSLPGVRPRRGSFVRGQVVETGDGRLLMATYDRTDPNSNILWTVHLYEAHINSPLAFKYRGVIASPANKVGFTETSLAAAANGDLVAYSRTAGARDQLAIARSRDGGATWSAPAMSGFVGSPAVVQRLNDGRTILISGIRNRRPMAIGGCLLDDEGLPALSTEFTVRTDPPVRDFGYPWACRLRDGKVLVLYYWNTPSGAREIHANILQFH